MNIILSKKKKDKRKFGHVGETVNQTQLTFLVHYVICTCQCYDKKNKQVNPVRGEAKALN